MGNSVAFESEEWLFVSLLLDPLRSREEVKASVSIIGQIDLIEITR